MEAQKETALYLPIKDYLQAQGFNVKAEVRGCDIAAMRGEELVIVELKMRFNMTLVLQGLERQKITDAVYLAIATPKNRRGHEWTSIQNLCRRLGLGLLTVDFRYQTPKVEVVVNLEPYVPRKNKRKKALLVNEFKQRSGDFNIGGSTRRPIVTSYREEALQVASYLRQHGPASVRAIKEVVDSPKVASILQKNFYGWFSRIERGIYELTLEGASALEKYAYVSVEQKNSTIHE